MFTTPDLFRYHQPTCVYCQSWVHIGFESVPNFEKSLVQKVHTSFESIEDEVEFFGFLIEFIELQYVLMSLAMMEDVNLFKNLTSVIVDSLINYLKIINQHLCH